MRIKTKTRNGRISDKVRNYAIDKLLSVAEKSMPVIDATLTFDKEKHLHVVEINLVGKHINFHGSEKNEDIHAATDTLVSKVQRQLRKAKEKIKSHSAKHLGVLEALPPKEADDGLDDEILEPEMVEILSLTTKKAVKKLFKDNLDFLLFIEPETKILNLLCKQGEDHYIQIPISDEVTKENQSDQAEVEMTTFKINETEDDVDIVIEAQTLNVPHQTIDVAISQYHNDASRSFYFYVNAYSKRPNILYYKDNHKISLIVPCASLYEKEVSA